MTARNKLKRGNRSNRRGIQTSLLYAILIDLENTSNGLKKLTRDRYMQQIFGDLITTFQTNLSEALDYLEAAVHWYQKYEELGTSLDEKTDDSADRFFMRSMRHCQECHDILDNALEHPDMQNVWLR